jgi:alkanesulfonate monooxygenase SsuD/methylene tetrahydromethanopterin reductase-like flavin-dependent oxidoreductase (luciferase family)
LKVGLFFEWPNPDLHEWREVFNQSIEQIQLAEELGFDFVLVAEHHFSNYGMSPAPLMQALAIAERTKTIKVGTGVLVLPVWQPLRLAEEVAVLDNLTGGRFICGVGRGYQSHEFGRFGVTGDDSRARFNECLDIILKAWTEADFTYEGEYNSVPKPVTVWPKPFQKPHPPVWLAGTSPDTLKLAAGRDFPVIISGYAAAAGVSEAVASLLPLRQAAGLPADTWEMGIQAISMVCDTEAEARDCLRYARWQNRANRSLGRSDVVEGCANAIPYDGEPADERFWDQLYYGNPDRVIKKYTEIGEAGATFLSSWTMLGGVPHERIMRSIELMGREVLPGIRDVKPRLGLAEELLSRATPADAVERRGRPPAD